jgi:hypothetical protein
LEARAAVGGHGKTGERIVLRRVKTERYDQRCGRKSANGLFGDAERLLIAVISGTFRQRDIEIGAEAGAGAALMGIAPDEGVEEGRIGVDRNRQHVGPFVENALRTVAVMDVDVEDRHALMLEPQMGCRDCAVVEETEAARQIAVGMMAGRTAERVGRVLAVHDELRRRRRYVGGRARRSPGAGADRTGRIDGVPAETADNMGRIGRSVAHRMHVGNHFGAGIAKCCPGVPGFCKKAEIFRTVNPGARALPEHHRRNQIMLASLQPCQQPVGAFRLFGGALDHAAHQKELRIVTPVQFGMDGLHANAPVLKK